MALEEHTRNSGCQFTIVWWLLSSGMWCCVVWWIGTSI